MNDRCRIQKMIIMMILISSVMLVFSSRVLGRYTEPSFSDPMARDVTPTPTEPPPEMAILANVNETYFYGYCFSGPEQVSDQRFEIYGCPCGAGHVADGCITRMTSAAAAYQAMVVAKSSTCENYDQCGNDMVLGFPGFYGHNNDFDPLASSVYLFAVGSWLIGGEGQDDTPLLRCSGCLAESIVYSADELGYLEGVDPFPTYTPEPSPTPTATSEPSSTPAQTPEPTPPCSATGVTLSMPAESFRPGDICWCSVTVCNAEGIALNGYPLFCILDVYGVLFFWPGFGGFNYYAGVFEPGRTDIDILKPFIWPDTGQSSGSATWYAALTDPEITQIVGSMDILAFSWLP